MARVLRFLNVETQDDRRCVFEPVATPHGAAAVEVLHADGRIDAWCMACFEARPMASMGTRVHVSCSCRCPEIWALQP